MKQLAILFIFSVLLLSCKKDKLTGDKEIFVGKWEWFRSTHLYGICTGDPPQTEILTPANGYTYSMEFLKKGILNYYENGAKLGKDRIIFIEYTKSGNYFEFDINLNNDADITGEFNGYVSSDTLVLIYGFPYYDDPNGCEKYLNYFVKE